MIEETIAAISTASGEGGIGIVRISGPNSLEILEKIFFPVNKEPLINRRLTYGNIVDPLNGQIVDEVLAVYMKGPHTYTCEDVVEINCHGSVVALGRVLSLCYANGARPAEKGEFTKRAFLGGRLDLSQAEAVMDMVSAKTVKTFDVALSQLSGKISEKIRHIRDLLLDILTNIAVNIDYPDEDIEVILYDSLRAQVEQAADQVKALLTTANTGRIVREGLKVAIIGRPNVGKSSLMNSLLGIDRAIVTEIAGTTRDTIEETISIGGIPVILTDTAGIRDTDNPIEKIGIERSKESFNKADLVIFMLDSSSPLTQEDLELMDYLGQRPAFVLLNKQDKGALISPGEIKGLLPESQVIETSMADGQGIELIEKEISRLVYTGGVSVDESLIVTNARHENLLDIAYCSLMDGIVMIDQGEALDFIEVDINRSYKLLGEIIGETVADDIIDSVFSRFCLGK